MRRIITTLLVALAVIAGVGGVALATNGSGDSITRARLERSLPISFANQYTQLAGLLGHDRVTPASLHASAMCDKHGPDVPDVGPGSDWVCLMGWTDPNVPMPPEGYGKFEVTVRTNDCYTAGGSSKLVGYATITDTHGHQVNNPAYEFDGCFDPAGDNAATGVSYPSVLNVASTVLTVATDNSTGLQVTCGTGAEGCAGTIIASSGGVPLGSMDYRLKEEATATLPVPQLVPVNAAEVSFAFKPTVGMAPPKDSTVAVQR